VRLDDGTEFVHKKEGLPLLANEIIEELGVTVTEIVRQPKEGRPGIVRARPTGA
jgi:hypothetical protein